MAIARLANIGVPLLLKKMVDELEGKATVLAMPMALLFFYGALRLSASIFQELRGIVFARVLARTTRQITLRVFEHLHSLSLRFHLDRHTGGVSRDLERGMASIGDLLDWTIYTVAPTLIEITVVGFILISRYDWTFALITLSTLVFYTLFTLAMTAWRLRYYRAMNEADTAASATAVDSLLNYETVKHFGNEKYEIERYDVHMRRLEIIEVASLKSLSLLNIGQAVIVSSGLTLLLWRAAAGVVAGNMSIGDLVLVNAFLLQLAAPLNYLGLIYREIKQGLSNIERMFDLLDTPCEILDRSGAKQLKVSKAEINFEQVSFYYDSSRSILRNINFRIKAGETTAIVGATGVGKSTLARLLLRFYDVTDGRITVDGQDIRNVTQDSLRRAIGIVPQDTVLFNDTIYYNIAYGRPEASREDVLAAAKAAHIHDFIDSLPLAYDTLVGERGLKLSGGEKQRVAIARTLLKNPVILVLDEATSALDNNTEKIIQGELAALARHRTSLVIAHRLSTVINADQIIVLDGGQIAEKGTHAQLLAQAGLYSTLWASQQRGQRENFAG
jgi:ATP-binding cassette subfamily B protein